MNEGEREICNDSAKSHTIKIHKGEKLHHRGMLLKWHESFLSKNFPLGVSEANEGRDMWDGNWNVWWRRKISFLLFCCCCCRKEHSALSPYVSHVNLEMRWVSETVGKNSILHKKWWFLKRFKWWNRRERKTRYRAPWTSSCCSTLSHNSIQLHANNERRILSKSFLIALAGATAAAQNESINHTRNERKIWVQVVWRQNMKRQLIHENNLFALRCLSRISLPLSLSLFLIPCHISIRISILSRRAVCVCVYRVHSNCVSTCCRQKLKCDVIFFSRGHSSYAWGKYCMK